MVSTTSRIALKIAQRQKTSIRLEELFDFIKRQIEAPLTMGEIVIKKRGGYVEVKCTKHKKTIKIRSKERFQSEDLNLCRECSKASYTSSMNKKMNEYHIKMVEKYTVGKNSKLTLHSLVKSDIASYEREIKSTKTVIITPEMIKNGLEDYYKRGGTITKIV